MYLGCLVIIAMAIYDMSSNNFDIISIWYLRNIVNLNSKTEKSV